MKENEKLRPLGKRVLIKPTRTPEKSEGGIYIPESARKNLQQALVLAVGDGVENIKPGEMVIYDHYTGICVDRKNNHIMLNLENVFAILVPEQGARRRQRNEGD